MRWEQITSNHPHTSTHLNAGTASIRMLHFTAQVMTTNQYEQVPKRTATQRSATVQTEGFCHDTRRSHLIEAQALMSDWQGNALMCSLASLAL
jgi:hypothetical protein